MTTTVTSRPTERVVTLQFEVSDSSFPARTTAEVDGCRFRLEGIIPGTSGYHTAYFTVDGCDPERILTRAADDDTGEALFADYSDTRGMLKVTGPDDIPLLALTAEGAVPRTMVVADGTTALAVEVPPEHDVNEIISQFNEAYPDAELTVRRQESYETPIFTGRGLRGTLQEVLTDRQMDIFQVAYEEGFFEWPRESTGAELSEKLGITPPTFHQHLRVAEQRLMQLVFTARGLPDQADADVNSP